MSQPAGPVVFHIPGSVLRDPAKLRPFYGKIGEGLRGRGVTVDYVLHDHAAMGAQIEADKAFHILNHGRMRHPRVLNAGLSFIPPFYYMDPWGIRAFSSLTEKRFDPAEIDPVAAAAFYADLVARLVGGRKSRYLQPETVLPVPQGCIAVFLQTETHRAVGDLCHLTMRRMIKALLDRDDPRAIVVKPHPRDADLETLAWLAQKSRKDKRLQIVPGNIHDILAACDCVVTINSAVGVEAFLHRKPVVLCGQADFHHCAVTLRDGGSMDAAIAQAIATDWPFEAFLYWYFGLNCLSADAPDLVDLVAGRILNMGFELDLHRL